MKKIFTLVCLLACATFAKAQDREFKPFKVDLSLGYASPSGSGASGGVLFAVEPKYAIKDQIAIGLRWELALMARVQMDGTSEVKGVSSYVPTVDYYFGVKKSRIFAGLGAGLYQYAGASVNMDTNSESDIYSSYSKFGVVPRIGAELSHFRIAVEYNIVPKYKIENTSTELSNGYLSVKLGAFICGGKY